MNCTWRQFYLSIFFTNVYGEGLGCVANPFSKVQNWKNKYHQNSYDVSIVCWIILFIVNNENYQWAPPRPGTLLPWFKVLLTDYTTSCSCKRWLCCHVKLFFFFFKENSCTKILLWLHLKYEMIQTKVRTWNDEEKVQAPPYTHAPH